jgi:hypothetical protein
MDSALIHETYGVRIACSSFVSAFFFFKGGNLGFFFFFFHILFVMFCACLCNVKGFITLLIQLFLCFTGFVPFSKKHSSSRL